MCLNVYLWSPSLLSPFWFSRYCEHMHVCPQLLNAHVFLLMYVSMIIPSQFISNRWVRLFHKRACQLNCISSKSPFQHKSTRSLRCTRPLTWMRRPRVITIQVRCFLINPCTACASWVGCSNKDNNINSLIGNYHINSEVIRNKNWHKTRRWKLHAAKT